MNAKQANSMPISSYLESIGIMPARTTNHYSMFQSPFRNDRNPSLKVSHQENLWIDFGEGAGGTLIDLVLRINPHLNVSEAIKDIRRRNSTFFSFHQQNTLSGRTNEGVESRFESWNAPDPKHDSKDQVDNTKKLLADREKILSGKSAKKTHADTAKYLKNNTCTIDIYKLQEVGNNPAINSYLLHRGIQIETAKPFCKEIYYLINGKKYFGLANRNHKGWSIRNKYWKGCTAQGYSYFSHQKLVLFIFEGIFDFLSFLEIENKSKKSADILILNSLINLRKAIKIIGKYPSIELFLDYDEAGREATNKVINQFPNAQDASKFYSSCKDLNDYYLTKVKC